MAGSHRHLLPVRLTCGLRKGTKGHEFRVQRAESPPHRGMGENIYPPLPPLRQALFPTFARGDSLDQAQRSVGRAGKGSFSCWCSAHRLFCLRPLSCRLCSEAICWCLWERGTDWQGPGLGLSMGAKLQAPGHVTARLTVTTLLPRL